MRRYLLLYASQGAGFPVTNSPIPTPTFSPAPGAYAGPQSVSIYCATPGVSIYYTTDGSIPNALSTPYLVPINVAATETIRAIAFLAGVAPSGMGIGAYIIGSVPAIELETLGGDIGLEGGGVIGVE